MAVASSSTMDRPKTSICNRRCFTVPVITTVVMLIGSIALLFTHLGHYSLWTDEASTAITAAGVWRTGDTSAWLDDHNLLTYRDGLLLKNQKDRYTSPLQFYIAAPFIGLLGKTAFACRLPFALCGLGTVILILLWLHRWRPQSSVWIAATVILLTSTSFFLFQRQCRYFALATFLSALTAYLYATWNGTGRKLFAIAIVMSLLLSAQYLDYAAVVGCLLIDYGIWGRRRHAIRGFSWFILILPQLLTALLVCSIWNPIARATDVIAPAATVATAAASTARATASISSHSWLADYLKLYWWNFRDLVACDFAILPLIAICPILYFKRRDPRLLRSLTAIVVFVGAIAFFTAHPLTPQGNAEVRYLAPLLPLCIVTAILAVAGMASLQPWVTTVLCTLASITVLISSTYPYYRELLHPALEPYTPVATWINSHVQPDQTIYVCPDWCVSPTMWNAPAPTYVWQLSDPKKPDYAALPRLYFKGQIPPDYLIAYGPFLDEVNQWRTLMAQRGIDYEPLVTFPVYYKEMFRPELIWRSSTTIQPAGDEQVYLFQRIGSNSLTRKLDILRHSETSVPLTSASAGS